MIKIAVSIIIACTLLSSCAMRNKTEDITDPPHNTSAPSDSSHKQAEENPIIETPEVRSVSLINTDGMILKERFNPPDGFLRLESEKDSFAEFLQCMPVKPDGSKVRYFDGTEKMRDVYMAVVDYPLGERDLQQCADAVMRLRAEYLYSIGKKDSISFNFVNGFTAGFSKWADGYGVSVDGSNASWVKNNGNNGSYESLQKYLDIVYAYSSTISLEKELVSKDIEDIAIGDVFIVGGSPGHCVIVVDMAVSESEKVFMLAQSYMPAQDIQILKSNEEGSPWYSASIGDKLITPEWIFEKTQLKTWE